MRNQVIFALLLFYLGSNANAECYKGGNKHEHVQWSEAFKFHSPQGSWEISSNVDLHSEENSSPVSVLGCESKIRTKIFSLERSAELYWSADDRWLVVLNAPAANENEIYLYDMKEFGSRKFLKRANFLHKRVKELVLKKIGKKNSLVFYLPQIVELNTERMMLTVGGAFASSDEGPMTSYCYGFVVDPKKAEIHQIKKKFPATKCRVSP